MTYLQMGYLYWGCNSFAILFTNFLGSSKYGQLLDPLFLCLWKEVQLPEYAPRGLPLSNERNLGCLGCLGGKIYSVMWGLFDKRLYLVKLVIYLTRPNTPNSGCFLEGKFGNHLIFHPLSRLLKYSSTWPNYKNPLINQSGSHGSCHLG